MAGGRKLCVIDGMFYTNTDTIIKTPGSTQIVKADEEETGIIGPFRLPTSGCKMPIVQPTADL